MFRDFVGDDERSERCGLFLCDDVANVPHSVTDAPPPSRHVREVIELPNRHPEPGINFRIWQRDVDDALRRHNAPESRLMGYWHTHPQGSVYGPSEADLDAILMGAGEWWHCVYMVEDRILIWFDVNGEVLAERDLGLKRAGLHPLPGIM